MIARLRKRASHVFLTVLALLVVAGGVAYATVPDSNGVIHGCRDNKSGALRIVDPSKHQGCVRTESALAWNLTGRQGVIGPQGPAGSSSRYLTFGVYDPSTGTIAAAIDTTRSNTTATVTNPRAGVYCIGGLSPAPKSALISAATNVVGTGGSPAPVNDDTIASALVAFPPDSTLTLCANTDQIRVTTYAAGAGLVDRVFTIWVI